MAQQGREGRTGSGRPRLGELLLKHGVVAPEQIDAALKSQRSGGQRLGKNLVQLGFLDENTLVKSLAAQLNIAGANLNKMEIPPEVQRLVPLEVMREAGVLPVKLHENTLYLGMTDPTDSEALRRIKPPAGSRLALVVLPQSQWEYAMDFFRKYGWGKRTLAKGRRRAAPQEDFDLRDLLEELLAQEGSEVHLSVGAPPTLRAGGLLQPLALPPLTVARMEQLLLPRLAAPQRARFAERSEIDLVLTVEGSGRFRANLYRTRGQIAAVLRPVADAVPAAQELGLPPLLLSSLSRREGLILIAGASGHGKSTTFSCLVDTLNASQRLKIVTIEDPILYAQAHQQGIVDQREIGSDTPSFPEGLRRILGLGPEVVGVDELGEPESVGLALAAAASGRLVLATINAIDAPGAIDRMTGACPEPLRRQIRHQLAAALLLVVAQRLVPRAAGKGLALACELLAASARVRSAIRETGGCDPRRGDTPPGEDFLPLESSLAELCRRREISAEEALKHAEDERLFQTLVRSR